jgi:hypothetical protein
LKLKYVALGAVKSGLFSKGCLKQNATAMNGAIVVINGLTAT